MGNHWLDNAIAQVTDRVPAPAHATHAAVGELAAELLGLPTVAVENAALRHGGTVRESAAAAGVARAAGKRYVTKIGEADRINQNRRIYPRAEWAAAVDRANAEQCPNGTLGGAVDHVGMLDGGNAKNRCILWKELTLDAAGNVFGSFEIVEGHTDGANLAAWLRAGGALGFSTYGRAKARDLTADERRTYGVPEGEHAVVMEQYSLIGIDSVDNPSVRSAWMLAGRQ
ncbi:MAG: hypothetical protein JWO31_105 [Phycisphaerales bacterium]|nr:hypothetical protein [Phycisphaerales bacterium]